jgi:hypothetical protein
MTLLMIDPPASRHNGSVEHSHSANRRSQKPGEGKPAVFTIEDKRGSRE